MIDRAHALPVVRQSKLLSLSRSTAYYTPRGESEKNLTVMQEIDRLYMERIAHDQEHARGARAQDRQKPRRSPHAPDGP